MTHSVAHLTQRKKCDDFWLTGVNSFQTIYNMNDFAAIIFSRYYTLILINHTSDKGYRMFSVPININNSIF